MPAAKKTTATAVKSAPRAAKKTVAKKPEKAERPKASPEIQLGLKLRIKLRAYDHKIIDNSARQIIDIANRYGAEVLGPVPLPTEILKYTVNRSSFIHKNAREQFEMRVHKRIIDILNPNQEIIEALRDLNLPSGVDITIKI
jgi:small subunit ribosomal protein S10